MSLLGETAKWSCQERNQKKNAFLPQKGSLMPIYAERNYLNIRQFPGVGIPEIPEVIHGETM